MVHLATGTQLISAFWIGGIAQLIMHLPYTDKFILH